eukprot:SAG31_NODE_14329_length_813_cov_1.392157_1_plen_41_part_10
MQQEAEKSRGRRVLAVDEHGDVITAGHDDEELDGTSALEID